MHPLVDPTVASVEIGGSVGFPLIVCHLLLGDFELGEVLLPLLAFFRDIVLPV